MPDEPATPQLISPSLAESTAPAFTAGALKVRLVDLFAGCGGLTLGAAQAAHALGAGIDVRLAVDIEDSATAVYKSNFGSDNVMTASVEDFFDDELNAALTATELNVRQSTGNIDLLVGGPPCQGNSDLNNKTRRNDPKNELYLRMARAARVLEPRFVLIENVPTVRHATAEVVQVTCAYLEALGYKVHTETVGLHALGVAQKRRRHLLLASRVDAVDPKALLVNLATRTEDSTFNLRWAIGDLEDLNERAGYDIAPRASADNLKRMQYLLDKKKHNLPNPLRPKCHQGSHSYTSMYGRLNWDEPAQTVTSGFGSIGQGRYMHPSQLRALTAHEAARIQGFPDYFSFEKVTKRGDLAVMIGNAVPPALMREIATTLIPALQLPSNGTAPVTKLPPSAPEPEWALAG